MRNPWGAESYTGPYGDTDWGAWDGAVGREIQDHTPDTRDGAFWTDAKTFHKSFQMTHGNPDVQDMHLSYFAAFEVDTPDTLYEHLTIESDVDQTVYISAYTYDDQHVRNSGCQAFRGGSALYFTHDRASDWLYPMDGWSHHEPLDMSAGEKLRAQLQAYWSDGDLMPHDFSVVVLAEKSPVRIVLDDQRESESFPTYRLSENVTRLSGEKIEDDSDQKDGGNDGGDNGHPDNWAECDPDALDDDCFDNPHVNVSADEHLAEAFQYEGGPNYIRSDI